ncbi:hypothetical protein GYA19_06100 [Candidatus Beckwithbacteria bacterium]|nr:hypothetical protein [Candidatus Beckwithbacteria bacterium]
MAANNETQYRSENLYELENFYIEGIEDILETGNDPNCLEAVINFHKLFILQQRRSKLIEQIKTNHDDDDLLAQSDLRICEHEIAILKTEIFKAFNITSPELYKDVYGKIAKLIYELEEKMDTNRDWRAIKARIASQTMAILNVSGLESSISPI